VVPSQFDPLTKYTFYCWLREGHGVIGLTEAIAQSCDIYFYHVGGGFESFQGLGVDRLTHYLRSFGLGRETGIDLPGEATGLVPDNLWKLRQPWNTRGEPWLTGDTYNLAIGQGFGLATPLQMANVTAAIANGGTLYRPQLVLQVVDAEGRVIRGFQPEVIGQLPISQKNLERVKDGMRAAVTHGTATACNFPDLEVAGKTGTAEFGEVDAKGNRPSHAWYISFAPFSNPTVAMVVFVEGGGNGAKIAVPIAARIYQYLFNQPELPSAPEHGE
jgi:penicillin-binding protein 2